MWITYLWHLISYLSCSPGLIIYQLLIGSCWWIICNKRRLPVAFLSEPNALVMRHEGGQKAAAFRPSHVSKTPNIWFRSDTEPGMSVESLRGRKIKTPRLDCWQSGLAQRALFFPSRLLCVTLFFSHLSSSRAICSQGACLSWQVHKTCWFAPKVAFGVGSLFNPHAV